MNNRNKILCILLSLILCAVLVIPAFAVGETGCLTLHYVLEDCTFRFYFAASFNADGSLCPNAGYDKLPVDWSEMDADALYELAYDLDTMVVAENISADRTVTTDGTGTAIVEALPYGLWLIAGETETRDRTIYTTKPLLVSFSGTMDDGTVVTNLDLTISKYAKDTDSDPIQISTIKIWEDNQSDTRPTSIQATLFCDSQPYDTVTLSAENNWKYTWKDLERSHTWKVAERDVPAGYTVSYSTEGTVYYITNTNPTPPPTPPDVPQTGVNWTPVIVLIPIALLCLIIGVWRRKQSEG